MEEKKNTYLTLHKNFVRSDIEYVDHKTGETKTFNQVTLPRGTTIEGVDVGCYQFSPLFVNESKYKGKNFRDIPLLTTKEIWLKRTILDDEGQPIIDDKGRPELDIVKVMPQELKTAINKQRSDYLDKISSSKEQSLQEKAQEARNASQGLSQSTSARAHENIKGR